MLVSPLNLTILFGLLLFNSLLAAARTALVNASRARLKQMQEAGVSGAALARQVAEDSTRLLATLRFAQNLCRFLTAGLIALLFEPLVAAALQPWLGAQADPLAFAALLLFATWIVMGVGELLPEAWVMRDPEAAACWFAGPVAVLEWVLNPLVRGMLFATERLTTPLAGKIVPLVTAEEIKTLVDASEEGGAIEEEEKEMIYSVLEISETTAREIMVPRIDMFALSAETSLAEAREALLNVGHSRIPIYQDTIDTIIGLLYAKDLLRARNDQPPPLRSLLRPAFFIPETKKLDALLAELQKQRIHMAIVVDEYGGTAGLVTLEDIVEEIVGDIRDEYDVNEEAYYEAVGAGVYIFDARLDLDEVNELLGSHLESDESDTLGGFIYGQLGHVPIPGERVTTPETEFEVLSVAGRRIRKVRGQPRTPETAPTEPVESQDHDTHVHND